MARLKTFVTDSGFFQLAVAAPSMKAALAAWGFTHNAFTQGFAKQTHDAAIVQATEAEPGTVLRRPLGGKGAFQKNSALPTVKTTRAKAKKPDPGARKRKAAQARLDKAQAAHDKRAAALGRQRDTVEARIAAEDEGWQRERAKLEKAAR